MQWSFRIGRIGGTDIKLHVTFLALVAWWAWSAYADGGRSAAVQAVAFLLALFACVLLHEFGHILMAGRFGVRTPDVILLPIGGLARLERMPEEPRQELLIAAAGPAVTLAIALALYAGLRLAGAPLSTAQLDPGQSGLVQQVLWVNVALLLFNLLPIFPMDGGRMLRALLGMRLGLRRATRIAARIGQGGAVVLGLWGLGFFSSWGLSPNVVLVLIAGFVFLAARAEASAVETRSAGRGLTVKDLMITQFVALPVHATLQQAADALLAGEQREFPVVDNWGRVEGLLTRDGLIRGLSQAGGGAGVERAMTAGVPPLDPAVSFEEALEALGRTGLPALPVVDRGGALVGLLTRDNVTDVLLVRGAGMRFPPA
ncbi:MAG TPA: site-2 protease family protein [Gemmatimonadales bacterium]|nr:site-2 protease family protein [Gemmatimonadales bacterium]